MYESKCKQKCTYDESGANCTHPKNVDLRFWDWMKKGAVCPHYEKKSDGPKPKK